MPGDTASAGLLIVHRLAVDEDLARILAVRPEDEPGQLRAPGAHEPGEAQDLAPPEAERDVA